MSGNTDHPKHRSCAVFWILQWQLYHSAIGIMCLHKFFFILERFINGYIETVISAPRFPCTAPPKPSQPVQLLCLKGPLSYIWFVWWHVGHDCTLCPIAKYLKATRDMILSPQRKMSLTSQGRDLSKSCFYASETSFGSLGYRMLTRNPLKVFYQDLCFISGSNVRDKN